MVKCPAPGSGCPLCRVLGPPGRWVRIPELDANRVPTGRYWEMREERARELGLLERGALGIVEERDD